MKKVLLLGLVYGLVLATLNTSVFYIGGLKAMLKISTPFIISLIAFVGVLVLLGRKTIRSLHSYVSYGTALKYLFVATWIGLVLNTSIQLVTIYRGEQTRADVIEFTIEKQKQSTEKTMRWLNAPEEEIEKTLDELDAQKQSGNIGKLTPWTIGGFMIGVMTSTVMALLYALIAAIFVRHPKSMEGGQA